MRAFNYDGGSISSIRRINFFAFAGAPPDDFFGANVAAADLDGNGVSDIVAARGPGAQYGPQIRSFEVTPGSGVTQSKDIPKALRFGIYGATVTGGNLKPGAKEQVYVGQGPDPGQDTDLRAYEGLGLTEIVPARFSAYAPLGLAYGVHAALAENPPGFFRAEPPAVVPTDALIVLLRDAVAAVPDSKYSCDNCDPNANIPQGYWNAWGADSQKQATLAKIDALLASLPDLADAAAVDNWLLDIRNLVTDPNLGIQPAQPRAEIIAQIDQIRGFYDPQNPTFPSTAVTARFGGFHEPDTMALSEPTGRLFIQRGTDRGVVHELDTERLVKLPDRPLPSGGTSLLLAAPEGRAEVYSVSTREQVIFVPVPCDTKPPIIGLRICVERQTTTIGSLNRLAPEGTVYPDQGFFDFQQSFTGVSIDSFFVTPPGPSSGLRPDTAYVSFRGSPTPATIVLRNLVAIEGVSDFTTATMRTIVTPNPSTTRPYMAMQGSPLTGSPYLYLLRPSGLDLLDTQTEVVTTDAAIFPTDFVGRKAMTAGVTNMGTPLIYVTNGERLLVYQPQAPGGAGSAILVDDVMIPSPTVALHLSMDGRFLLLTRYPQGSPIQSLALLDADTRLLIRDSAVAACPQSGPCAVVTGADPMALTIDGGHAIASSPDTNELKYVYIQPSRVVVNSSSVTSFAAAIPATAFAKPQDQQKLVKAFEKVTKALDKAAAFQGAWTQNPVLQAELEREAAFKGRRLRSAAALDAGLSAPGDEAGDDDDDDDDENERQEHLAKALDKLHKAMELFDGCTGGDPKKDIITDCDEARTLMHAARQLEQSIEGQLAPEPPKFVP